MIIASTINQHIVKFKLVRKTLQDYQDPNDTTLKIFYEPCVDFDKKTIELQFTIPDDIRKSVARLQAVGGNEERVEWLCRVATVPYGSTIVKCKPISTNGATDEYAAIYDFNHIPEKAQQHGVQVRLYARIKEGVREQGKVVSSSHKTVNISLERQGNGVLSIKSKDLGGPLWRLTMYTDAGDAFAPCIEVEKTLGDATAFLAGGNADIILPAVVRDIARYLMSTDEVRGGNDADMVRAWKVILDLPSAGESQEIDTPMYKQGEVDEDELNKVVDAWVNKKYLKVVPSSKNTLAERYQSTKTGAADIE